MCFVLNILLFKINLQSPFKANSRNVLNVDYKNSLVLINAAEGLINFSDYLSNFELYERIKM